MGGATANRGLPCSWSAPAVGEGEGNQQGCGREAPRELLRCALAGCYRRFVGLGSVGELWRGEVQAARANNSKERGSQM